MSLTSAFSRPFHPVQPCAAMLAFNEVGVVVRIHLANQASANQRSPAGNPRQFTSASTARPINPVSSPVANGDYATLRRSIFTGWRDATPDEGHSSSCWVASAPVERIWRNERAKYDPFPTAGRRRAGLLQRFTAPTHLLTDAAARCAYVQFLRRPAHARPPH